MPSRRLRRPETSAASDSSKVTPLPNLKPVSSPDTTTSIPEKASSKMSSNALRVVSL